MPIPSFVTQLNKRFANKALVHLAGLGPFVEVEHVGRRSGTVYRTPIMAFRDGSTVTIALTYGANVDWLKNLRAAGGGRLHHRGSLLTVGPPRALSTATGMARMPQGVRQILSLVRSHDFVELDVVGERPFTGRQA